MENRITRLFDEQKVNISEVARKTGIAYGTLYDIARGKTPFERISIDNLIKIAREFGMTADDLLGDEITTDPDRYELCQIYDSLDYHWRKALLACATGLHDAFQEEVADAIAQSDAENLM